MVTRDQDYTNVLLEDINHKFDIILEVSKGTQEQLKNKADKEDVAQLNDRMNVLETNQRQVIGNLKDLNIKVEKLDSRVATLER